DPTQSAAKPVSRVGLEPRSLGWMAPEEWLCPSGQMDGVSQGSARTLHLQRPCTVLGIEVLGDFAEWHGDAFRRHQEEPFGAPLVVENRRSLAGNRSS